MGRPDGAPGSQARQETRHRPSERRRRSPPAAGQGPARRPVDGVHGGKPGGMAALTGGADAKHSYCRRCRSRQQPIPLAGGGGRQHGLVKLTDDAERLLLLQLAAPRADHSHVRVARQAGDGPQQGGLARASAAFEHDETAPDCRPQAADRDRARHSGAPRIGRRGDDAVQRNRAEHRGTRAPTRATPTRRARRSRRPPDQARPPPLRRAPALAICVAGRCPDWADIRRGGGYFFFTTVPVLVTGALRAIQFERLL
jgi:hypothetical protein